MPFQHRYSSDGQNNKKTHPGPVTAQGEANDALVEERTYILEVRTGGQVFAKTFSSPLVSRPPLMKLGGVSQSLGQARGSLFLFNLTGSWTPRFARKRSRSSTWPVKRLLVQFRLTRARPNCGSRQLFHGLQLPIA